ncbi:MAG: hypothetical protein EON55_01870, partial [Alphaproteobacteria bacterium]
MMSHQSSTPLDHRVLSNHSVTLRRRLLDEAVRRVGPLPGLSLALSDQPGIGGCFVASEPLAAVDHGEFRYTPSLHHVLDEDVHAIERDIRRALKVFHAKQASLKPQVVAARKLAEWIIDRGTNPVSRS